MNQVAPKSSIAVSGPAPIVLNSLPNMPIILAKAAIKSGSFKVGDSLPAISAEWQNMPIDTQHLAQYNRICGFAEHKMPATYLWTRAFPLIMRILVSKQFPLPAMGQVHLSNQISVHKTFDISKKITITAAVAHSKLSSKGLEWTMQLTADVEGISVWSSQSTFLHRCKTGIERNSKTIEKAEGESQQWSLAKDLGRRYAAISGDYNPIHLGALSAKVFGFKQAIAHGMWSKARCLAALDAVIPESGYQVNVNFLKPVYLPSTVNFYTNPEDGRHNFCLYYSSGEHRHLQGSIS
ncbi:MaoC/PaaZ C-terminal domain-containing protein [bacterium]|nr:MaoC/PaaZ C-terminal domain-containing protein [bacterium]